ncbi:hypothetical protein SAMN05444161_1612 [Rhizobiales bacterium GAS191]|nr:hypothetical protein SAMN05444161_1612 [Rhizobiales bacterium GAS191]
MARSVQSAGFVQSVGMALPQILGRSETTSGDSTRMTERHHAFELAAPCGTTQSAMNKRSHISVTKRLASQPLQISRDCPVAGAGRPERNVPPGSREAGETVRLSRLWTGEHLPVADAGKARPEFGDPRLLRSDREGLKADRTEMRRDPPLTWGTHPRAVPADRVGGKSTISQAAARSDVPQDRGLRPSKIRTDLASLRQSCHRRRLSPFIGRTAGPIPRTL